MNFQLPPIYPITDTRISGLSMEEQVRAFIRGGARLVQLREKHASSRDFYESAKAAVDVAHDNGVIVLINDRVDIAVAAGADGVHLGQDDIPPFAAREVLGQNAIIGYSTHSVDQAARAVELPIDYIAIGPIFGTTTKADHDPVVGVEAVKAVRRTMGDFPLVAIGGVDPSNYKSVIEAGADSVAVISSVLSDPAKISQRIALMVAGVNTV